MQKPKLSFWQIWNMSFGFLGIQFGFALQNGNVSRIFQTLGADIDQIPILWIAAPVTGLIIQPIIGHMSDNTWGRLGRRRPFFLVGAILASIALILMPNSPGLWIAVGMLWIMDASINISMEPFRAFVGDMLPEEQRTLGFTMQSFFIGIGAFVASWLPYIMSEWFHIPNTAEDGLPMTVKLSFYLGGGVFLLAVLWTVLRTREYSPEEMAAFEAGESAEVKGESAEVKGKSAEVKGESAEVKGESAEVKGGSAEVKGESAEVKGGSAEVKGESGKSEADPGSKYLRRGAIWTVAGLLFAWPVYHFGLEKELYILAGGLGVFGILQLVSGALVSGGKVQNGLVAIITDLYHMPQTMKQLAVVQFFSWFALFSMWIYTTPAVTSQLYGTTDTTSVAYNEGANLVSGMMGWYNLFAAAFGLVLLPFLARLTNRKITHSIALVGGGLGLASIIILGNPHHMIYSMVGVGLAWASILAMPYAILTGSIPQKKMGVYMGIFNFFIVIPQILAATILGFMVKSLFNGNSMLALLSGGISLLVAAVLILFVNDVSAKK